MNTKHSQLMIGLGMIAVPTGIVASSLSAMRQEMEKNAGRNRIGCEDALTQMGVPIDWARSSNLAPIAEDQA